MSYQVTYSVVDGFGVGKVVHFSSIGSISPHVIRHYLRNMIQHLFYDLLHMNRTATKAGAVSVDAMVGVVVMNLVMT